MARTVEQSPAGKNCSRAWGLPRRMTGEISGTPGVGEEPSTETIIKGLPRCELCSEPSSGRGKYSGTNGTGDDHTSAAKAGPGRSSVVDVGVGAR